MELWNFFHNALHSHVYTALSVVVLAVMIAAAVIHLCNEKKKQNQNSEPGANGAEPAENAEGEKV